MKKDLANQLADVIKEFLKNHGNRELSVALTMANRTGILINDSVIKSIEQSLKSKERYKLIVESHTFDLPEDAPNIL